MSTGKWREKKDLLTAKDRLLWERVCHTIMPLHNELPFPIKKNATKIDHKKQPVSPIFSLSQGNQQRPTVVKKETIVITKTQKVHFFDHVVHRKIAKGHYPLEARLDLHGYGQEEAYFFLKEFLQSSQQSGLRYVLVITGKGRSVGSDGALYKFVPHWLSTSAFRYYVHAFERAAHQHGGRGALYVWLRRFVPGKGL
ncbi:Smr/MutS family protein [Bartonella machadoae]|uniref:Smr/MutS family protein n=1 Tax=Bartonella machadoae TaxID=2893471 RepID=UPI001F4CADF5|nr:Smr/MutS family protein [Bartonella machadoae]UNE54333.1 Smr/MutS family protein [Bartonella machadoae]